MLQITVDRFYRRPAVCKVDAQHRIEELGAKYQVNVLLDTHGRAVFPETRQSASPYQSPEPFFLDEKSGLICQCVSDPVVWVAGMHDDVRAVERGPFRMVIKK